MPEVKTDGEGIGYLSTMIAREIETAWRAGWRDGYHAGRIDGGSDFDWADIEADWHKSETRQNLHQGNDDD
jgi:hypothetical protein